VTTPAPTLNPGASAAAIQFHYDLGNDFYRLWLDPTMTYSAALWAEGDTLESAQLRKIDYHIEQARARGAARVLDVGCGWGGVLRRLADRAGVEKAVGLTLSRAQRDWVAAWAHPSIEVRLESWTEHEPGQPYDALISVGALEHFSRVQATEEERIAGYRAFFVRCREWLRPRGRLSLQTFAYGGLRPRAAVQQTAGTRFLAAEIFPETDPPRLVELAAACEGLFEVDALRNDRRDYARTCREWIRRLRAAREEVAALAGPEVFPRYERYLQLSQLGFETGELALYRITLARLGGS
jgi:cyclopropane-fatty-acyl-phospholipid synthase